MLIQVSHDALDKKLRQGKQDAINKCGVETL